MNLLLVNQYYPPDTAPTGQYLHQLAVALARRGHAVDVICSRRAYNGDRVYEAAETMDGVAVRRVRAFGFGRRSAAGKVLDYASFYASLAVRILAPARPPDLVLALTTPPHVGLLAAFAAWRHGVPHAHWIMDVYPDVLAAHGDLAPASLLYRALARLTRRELQGSPLVVCLADEMADRLRRHLADVPPATPSVCSVPLWSDAALRPWDEAAPPAFRREQGWGAEDLVLMYSGNMGRGHRLGEFLEAARRLRHDPRVHWVFAGGGKRRDEVDAALAREPGLHARLLPYAPPERLREHLCSADVHLVSLDAAWQGCMVPSKFQGIFAVGRPVIFVGGNDNSLARWISASGGGWVVAEGDVDGVLAAVEAARDPAECARRGRAARAFAGEHFDGTRNIARMIERIESCGAPR